jgi:hypothetical protein
MPGKTAAPSSGAAVFSCLLSALAFIRFGYKIPEKDKSGADMNDLIISPDAGAAHPTRWRKGESGNPAGRPPGARNKATLAAEALLEGDVEALTRAAIEKALDGDVIALRLCLQRLVPVMRTRPVRLDLPAEPTAEDVAAAMSAILRAMAAGELSPSEAATMVSVVEAQRRTVETIDLDRRIGRLEALMEEAPCAPARG